MRRILVLDVVGLTSARIGEHTLRLEGFDPAAAKLLPSPTAKPPTSEPPRP